MRRALVLFASSYGQTKAIAEAIASQLLNRGVHTDVVDVRAHHGPPAANYDAIVLGSRVNYGKHAPEITAYVQSQLRDLKNRPTYFFSVSNRAAGEPHVEDPGDYIRSLVQKTTWHPWRATSIAGGLPYRKYNPFLRFLMKMISKRTGLTTDTSHDHEFTDWAQVREFADSIVNEQRFGPKVPRSERERRPE